jgi:hypothetical protein
MLLFFRLVQCLTFVFLGDPLTLISFLMLFRMYVHLYRWLNTNKILFSFLWKFWVIHGIIEFLIGSPCSFGVHYVSYFRLLLWVLRLGYCGSKKIGTETEPDPAFWNWNPNRNRFFKFFGTGNRTGTDFFSFLEPEPEPWKNHFKLLKELEQLFHSFMITSVSIFLLVYQFIFAVASSNPNTNKKYKV